MAFKARFWVADKQEHVWARAIQPSPSPNPKLPGKVVLQIDEDESDERLITVTDKEFSELKPVLPDQEQGVDDICSVADVHEAVLLHTIRKRYARDEIYTRIMRTLLAVNPFTSLPLYSAQIMDRYRSASDSMDLPPHIFCVAQDAVQAIQQRPSVAGKDQAILISGESGAGKTESAKLILAFVAEAVRVSGAAPEGIDDRVLRTNPVLEAFGNAMTVRNNNSSRFGKWLDMRFTTSFELLRCSLTSYLLETTRVCTQERGERNYHIFFQLLQAREHPEFVCWGLLEPKKYKYIAEGQLTAPGIDDKVCFQELREAFDALDFGTDHQMETFRILAAILTLGNVEIVADGPDACKLAGEDTLRTVASHLQVNADELKKCLLYKRLVLGKDVTEKPLRADQASAVRDSLARQLYGQLFAWVLQKLNKTLTVRSGGDGDGERLLGLLDIAGFENFAKNSLEQLMINLSNEHLQQHFNRVVIKEEMDEFAKEGVNAPDLGHFEDNIDNLQLIDGPGGLLALLDEELTVPKATDQTYVAKVLKVLENNGRLIRPKVARCGFGVRHYAGDVTYTCDGWLEKNSDRPPDSSTDLMLKSPTSILKDIGETLAAEAESIKSQGGRGRKVKSSTAGFRASLRSLMEKVSGAQPHYIRCLKPNREKRPKSFNSQMVMEQIALCGVLATVRIRQQGFAYRMLIADFVSSYYCLLPKAKQDELRGADKKQAMQAIIDKVPTLAEESKEPRLVVAPEDIAVGITRVFLKMPAHKFLETAKERAVEGRVALVGRVFRGKLARDRAREYRRVRSELREVLSKAGQPVSGAGPQVAKRGSLPRRSTSLPLAENNVHTKMGSTQAMRELAPQLSPLLQEAEAIGLQCREVRLVSDLRRRIELELDVFEEVEKLKGSTDLVSLEKVLAKASGLQLTSVAVIKELEARRVKLRTQQPLLRAMRTALKEEEAESQKQQLTEVMDVLEELELKSPDAWLPDLEVGPVLAAATKKLEEYLAPPEAPAPPPAPGPVDAVAPPAEDATEPASKAEVVKRPVQRSKSWRAQVSWADGGEPSETDERLERAAEEYNAEALESLLRRLEAENLQARGEGDGGRSSRSRDHARSVFEQLQNPMFLQSALEEAAKEVAEPDPPKLTLRRLENLARQMEKMAGMEEAAAEAKSLLQKALIARSASGTRHRSVFRSTDGEELDIASRTFSNLSGFSRLKAPPSSWATASASLVRCSSRKSSNYLTRPDLLRRSSSICSTQSTAAGDSMLRFSKGFFPEALTQVPAGRSREEYEAAATQNFRNLLVSMGDRSAQECQRRASTEAVLELARADPQLRDEVYVQVLKQLSSNPSPRSVIRGWELLQRLCGQAPPGDELAEFLRAFCKEVESQAASSSEIGVLSRSCLAALDGDGAHDEEVSSSTRPLEAEVCRAVARIEAAVAAKSGARPLAAPSVAMGSATLAQRLATAVDQLLVMASEVNGAIEFENGSVHKEPAQPKGIRGRLAGAGFGQAAESGQPEAGGGAAEATEASAPSKGKPGKSKGKAGGKAPSPGSGSTPKAAPAGEDQAAATEEVAPAAPAEAAAEAEVAPPKGKGKTKAAKGPGKGGTSPQPPEATSEEATATADGKPELATEVAVTQDAAATEEEAAAALPQGKAKGKAKGKTKAAKGPAAPAEQPAPPQCRQRRFSSREEEASPQAQEPELKEAEPEAPAAVPEPPPKEEEVVSPEAVAEPPPKEQEALPAEAKAEAPAPTPAPSPAPVKGKAKGAGKPAPPGKGKAVSTESVTELPSEPPSKVVEEAPASAESSWVAEAEDLAALSPPESPGLRAPERLSVGQFPTIMKRPGAAEDRKPRGSLAEVPTPAESEEPPSAMADGSTDSAGTAAAAAAPDEPQAKGKPAAKGKAKGAGKPGPPSGKGKPSAAGAAADAATDPPLASEEPPTKPEEPSTVPAEGEAPSPAAPEPSEPSAGDAPPPPAAPEPPVNSEDAPAAPGPPPPAKGKAKGPGKGAAPPGKGKPGPAADAAPPPTDGSADAVVAPPAEEAPAPEQSTDRDGQPTAPNPPPAPAKGKAKGAGKAPPPGKGKASSPDGADVAAAPGAEAEDSASAAPAPEEVAEVSASATLPLAAEEEPPAKGKAKGPGKAPGKGKPSAPVIAVTPPKEDAEEESQKREPQQEAKTPPDGGDAGPPPPVVAKGKPGKGKAKDAGKAGPPSKGAGKSSTPAAETQPPPAEVTPAPPEEPAGKKEEEKQEEEELENNVFTNEAAALLTMVTPPSSPGGAQQVADAAETSSAAAPGEEKEEEKSIAAPAAPSPKGSAKGKGKPPVKGKPAAPAAPAMVPPTSSAEAPAAASPEEGVVNEAAPAAVSSPKGAAKGAGKAPPPPGKGKPAAPAVVPNTDSEASPAPSATEGTEAASAAVSPAKGPAKGAGKAAPPPGKGKPAALAEVPPPDSEASPAPSATEGTEAASAAVSPAKGPAKGTGKAAPPPGKGKPAAPTVVPPSDSEAPPAPSATEGTEAASAAASDAKGPAKGAGKATPPPGKGKPAAPAEKAPAEAGGKLVAPEKRVSRTPSPRRDTTAPLMVLGVGSGGIEELRGLLSDDMVAWALLRFEVGSGSFARTKFVALHFNGDEVRAMQRGRLNGRTKEAMELLGDAHASVEVKRTEEVEVGSMCERLLKVFAADDGVLGGGASASALRQAYEEKVQASLKKQRTFEEASMTQVGLTVKERSQNQLTKEQALRAVGDAKGPFNWCLLEPVNFDVHNAGFGGLEEMKEWLEDDMVMYGLIRLSFRSPLPSSLDVPATVKHVFVHWRGPNVGAVKRGRWNARYDEAASIARQVCILTLRKSVTYLEELDLAELIKEIERLTILDSGASSTEAGNVGISIEDYMHALEEEREEQIKNVLLGGEEHDAVAESRRKAQMLQVSDAVSAIRSGGGEEEWNFTLIGLEQAG